MLSPFTTSAARASNGSRRARERSNGRGCHAAVSLPTPSVSSFMRSPIISIPRHDRLQHRLPSIGAVNIARAQGAAFQIAILVENERRMIAGAVIVTVPDTVFLFAMRQAHA